MGEITLEKNKDYIEMIVYSTYCTFTPDEAKISVEGYSYGSYWRLPDTGERYSIISTEKFDALQKDDQHYREMTKQLNEANEALLKRVRRYHELIKECEKNYKTLSNLVGFSSVEEVQEYLTNNVECDTLHEAILKLRDEVTYTWEKLAIGNSENNSWKAAAECNTPRELMVKLNQLHDDIKELKERYDLAVEMIGKWQLATGQFLPNIDDDELASWKEVTGFKTPEEAKEYWVAKLSESGKVNESLAREIRSWREETGCSTPEEAKKKLKGYKNRLDSTKQSASIAIRHLDNIVFRDDKRSDWSDK